MRTFVVAALVCVSLLTGSGCASRSLRTIQPSKDPARPGYSDRLKTGDHVVLRLRDGGRAEFVVSAVEPDAVVAADGTRYAYAEITVAQVGGVSRTPSTILIVAVAVAVFWGVAFAVGNAASDALTP